MSGTQQQTSPLSTDGTVVHEGEQATARLSEIGLTETILRDAILIGELAASSVTENDPRTIAGLLRWGKTTRGLREQARPLGWMAEEKTHLSLTVNPSKTIAIVVTTGDENTGNPKATPKSKYPKGPATVDAVDCNQQQLDMFIQRSEPAPEPAANAPQNASAIVTWLLLIARTTTELRYELSLPSGVGPDGRVEKWSERIVFMSMPLAPAPDMSGVEEAVEVDPTVQRRAQ